MDDRLACVYLLKSLVISAVGLRLFLTGVKVSVRIHRFPHHETQVSLKYAFESKNDLFLILDLMTGGECKKPDVIQ